MTLNHTIKSHHNHAAILTAPRYRGSSDSINGINGIDSIDSTRIDSINGIDSIDSINGVDSIDSINGLFVSYSGRCAADWCERWRYGSVSTR